MADDFTNQALDHERDLRQFLEGLTPEERRDRIYLQPAFRDAYNELIQAHQIVQAPKYFWDHWVPILGPVASTLYMRLRQHCFYNPRTGERRDWCWPKQETLAREVGIRDRESLRAGIVALELHGFIKREPQYVLDKVTHRPRRASDKYYVFFEVPLIDADAVSLLISQASTQETLENQRSAHEAEKPPHRGPAVDNQPYEAGKPPQQAGGKTASKNKYLEGVLDNVNVATHAKEQLLRTRDLAQQMLEELGDRHSMGFYRKVAQTVPYTLIRRALSETKTARLEGNVSNAGAYFTSRIKQLAAEQRIKL